MKPAELLKFTLIRPTSGIELLAKRPKPLRDWTQDELKEFARRLEADKFTFWHYSGKKHLRVGDALALHYYLDPAVLALNEKGRLSELKRLTSKLEPQWLQLDSFLGFVPFMLKDIHAGKLPCIKDSRDLLGSFTTVEQFKSYANERRLSVYPKRVVKMESVDRASLPPKLRDMLEAYELFWKPVDQGGTVIPGRRSTEPDLVPFFLGRGYKPSKSKSMASDCRPITAHFGRPPKEYGGYAA